jgi:hypothetical protein
MIKEEVFNYADENNIDWDELTPYQARFHYNGCVIDYYWKGQRYHLIKPLPQERGSAMNIIQLLKDKFRL